MQKLITPTKIPKVQKPKPVPMPKAYKRQRRKMGHGLGSV